MSLIPFRAGLTALASSAALAACATAPAPDATAPAMAESAAQPVHAETYEADRQAILAMAGDYKVTFDFTETVPLAAGYELKDKKLSGGYEVVRVIADEGDYISLQHILVIDTGEMQFPVKHWRQDWRYEPAEVLTYIGGNAWAMKDVPAGERGGQWSQQVYQVDDSPRYGAVGAWRHEDGYAEWEPAAEWRPLPRRDMTTRDDYHAVDAMNRHTITPFGWVHEQDNTKLVLSGDTPEALVREIGVNTYRHNGEFDVSIATDYWAATAAYWDAVSDLWLAFERDGAPFAITVPGETEAVYQPLLGLAEMVQSGEMTMDEAVTEARAVIADHTTTDLAPLQARLRTSSHGAAY